MVHGEGMGQGAWGESEERTPPGMEGRMVADSGPIEFGPADEVGLGGDGEKLHGGMNKHGREKK